jgi:hypothetical protein
MAAQVLPNETSFNCGYAISLIYANDWNASACAFSRWFTAAAAAAAAVAAAALFPLRLAAR